MGENLVQKKAYFHSLLMRDKLNDCINNKILKWELMENDFDTEAIYEEKYKLVRRQVKKDFETLPKLKRLSLKPSFYYIKLALKKYGNNFGVDIYNYMYHEIVQKINFRANLINDINIVYVPVNLDADSFEIKPSAYIEADSIPFFASHSKTGVYIEFIENPGRDIERKTMRNIEKDFNYLIEDLFRQIRVCINFYPCLLNPNEI